MTLSFEPVLALTAAKVAAPEVMATPIASTLELKLLNIIVDNYEILDKIINNP